MLMIKKFFWFFFNCTKSTEMFSVQKNKIYLRGFFRPNWTTKNVFGYYNKCWENALSTKKYFQFFLSKFGLVRVANQVFRGCYTIFMVCRAKFGKKKFFRFFSTKEVELDLEKFWDLEKFLRSPWACPIFPFA